MLTVWNQYSTIIDKYFRNLFFFFFGLNERFQFFFPLYVLPCTWKIPYQSFDQSVAENLFITCLMLLTHLLKIALLTLGKHKIQFWKCLQFTFSFDSRDFNAFHLLPAMVFVLVITEAIALETANFNEMVHENCGLCESKLVSVNLYWNLGKIVCSSCFMFFTFWVFS